MIADRISETIAHFIGDFELKIEQARLRDAYDNFTAQRHAPDLDTPEAPAGPSITSDYQIVSGSYRLQPLPDLPHEALAKALPAPLPLPSGTGDALVPPPTSDDAPHQHFAGVGGAHLPAPEPAITLPGSVMTVTVEFARLIDNDLLGQGVFRAAADHAEAAGGLLAAAHELHAPGLDGLGALTEVPDLAAAEALAARMADFTALPGSSVLTSHDAGDTGLIVNGATAETLPLWSELLPAYHDDAQDAAGDAPLDGIAADTALPDWALPAEYSPNPTMPEGHSLVTGGNLAINEASVAVSWIDAPVIAVGGQWTQLDLISQVAAISDHDQGLQGAGSTSLYQTIEVTETAFAAPWQVTDGAGITGGPVTVSLGIIEGDLVVSNHVTQMLELFDNDQFGMAISAANASYILGGNTVFNASALIEAGLGYDLILIGGDYLTFNTIHQTITLLDNDVISGVPPGAGPQEGTGADSDWAAAPDNLVVNSARLSTVGVDEAGALTESVAEMLADLKSGADGLLDRLSTDAALAGLDHARVLAIKGDLIQANTIDQEILVSDSDDVRLDGAAPPGLELVAGSNALLNAAEIIQQGVDTLVMSAQQPYSDLLLHQAQLIDGQAAPQANPQDLASEAVAFLMEETQAQLADHMEGAGTTAAAPVGADAYDLMHGMLT